MLSFQVLIFLIFIYTMESITGSTMVSNKERRHVDDNASSIPLFCERCQSVGLPTTSDKSVKKREDWSVVIEAAYT